MTTQIKYLVFKGIEKKEQILFKSFLNLAKNDLPYQIVILKEGVDSGDTPDIVIVDDQYVFPENESQLKALPAIEIGSDMEKEQAGYLSRPVQWSDFKAAFTELEIEQVIAETEPAERVLPSTVDMVITDMDEKSESLLESQGDSSDEEDFSDEGEYDYELDNMSIDYHSFTNSDYMKVVDDVKQFKEGEEVPEVVEPVILVTDDESTSSNSVLVIETNSLDAWDFSETEMVTTRVEDAGDPSDPSSPAAQAKVSDVPERKGGFELAPNERYWLDDNEIIADNESILFIKPERKMVYSQLEPGKWQEAMQNKKLSKLPLPTTWRPKKGLNAYPISSVFWVNSLVNDTKTLGAGLTADEEYMLEKWPHFDLLELDNVLLKLCTMLFVRPESLNTLVQKSGYGRSTICGLMNACNELGILKKADEVKLEKLSAASNDEGMFGKIKDVFR